MAFLIMLLIFNRQGNKYFHKIKNKVAVFLLITEMHYYIADMLLWRDKWPS